MAARLETLKAAPRRAAVNVVVRCDWQSQTNTIQTL
jgi:hypothetical protein